MKTKPAFTLIELVVVFAIIAVLIGAGVTTLIGLKNSATVSGQANEFVSEARSVLSEARNSIYDTPDVQGQELPAAVGYNFQNGDYQKIKCEAVSSITFDYTCNLDTNYKNTKRSDVIFTPGGNCKGVLFEYSTGRINIFSSTQLSQVSTSDGTCIVVVNHKNFGADREIIFETADNTIEIK